MDDVGEMETALAVARIADNVVFEAFKVGWTADVGATEIAFADARSEVFETIDVALRDGMTGDVETTLVDTTFAVVLKTFEVFPPLS